MTANLSSIEKLVSETLAALDEPASETPPSPETTFRERFYEMIVLALGSLFAKSPTAGQMYDRTTLNRLTAGMDDTDSANLTRRADDWLRIEGIFTQTEGQKSYFLPLATLAVLSNEVSGILLGDLYEKILRRYQAEMPSDNLRRNTRKLAAHFLILRKG